MDIVEVFYSQHCPGCPRTRDAVRAFVGEGGGAVLVEHDIALELERARHYGLIATPATVVNQDIVLYGVPTPAALRRALERSHSQAATGQAAALAATRGPHHPPRQGSNPPEVDRTAAADRVATSLLLGALATACAASVCCFTTIASALTAHAMFGTATASLQTWRPTLMLISGVLLVAAIAGTWAERTTEVAFERAFRRRARDLRLSLVTALVVGLLVVPHYLASHP